MRYRRIFTVWISLSIVISSCVSTGQSNDANQDIRVNLDPALAEDLSAKGTANCYIVSEPGIYKFRNDRTAWMEECDVEVLWESFGTDVTPDVGDLIKNVSYQRDFIIFQTADEFREGNAVVAVKGTSISWSWHIWFTDQPQGQVYYNNAGVMMDRNLGATSATPGDVGALGLLYQWGRKDPFLGSSSINRSVEAKSTITWPSAVLSDSYYGTIEYAKSNPTTFIAGNSSDWYYSDERYSSNSSDLWTTFERSKSIYDPCPVGWRVPEGYVRGVWSKAMDLSANFVHRHDDVNMGMNFSGKFGRGKIIWYPTTGLRTAKGFLESVGVKGGTWAVCSDSGPSTSLAVLNGGYVFPLWGYSRSNALPVRCIKE